MLKVDLACFHCSKLCKHYTHPSTVHCTINMLYWRYEWWERRILIGVQKCQTISFIHHKDKKLFIMLENCQHLSHSQRYEHPSNMNNWTIIACTQSRVHHTVYAEVWTSRKENTYVLCKIVVPSSFTEQKNNYVFFHAETLFIRGKKPSFFLFLQSTGFFCTHVGSVIWHQPTRVTSCMKHASNPYKINLKKV